LKTDTTVVLQHQQDGPLEFADVQLPDPHGHQVMVRVLATGLCQSQIHWMHQPRQAPMLFGHEGYGVVAAVGPEVVGLREGDYVLVTWVPRRPPDGRLPEVATLELPNGVVARSPNVYTWSDYCVVDDLYVKPITGNHGPLMSVIGCAVITGAGAVMDAAQTHPGESVAVFGAGGVGLSAVVAAKVAGAQRIVAVDIDDSKLEFARQFGATDGINSSVHNPAQTIMRWGPLRCGCQPGVDVAIDCVAIPEVTTQALDTLRAGRLGAERGGRCAVVGIPKKPVGIDTADMMRKQKSLLGVLGGSARQERIDEFIDWARDGILDLETLITDRWRFEEIPLAAEALELGRVKGRAIALM
jgi:S-(hydroxymethyl)glutathione dehydrogenase/alcohol dehydrogenase